MTCLEMVADDRYEGSRKYSMSHLVGMGIQRPEVVCRPEFGCFVDRSHIEECDAEVTRDGFHDVINVLEFWVEELRIIRDEHNDQRGSMLGHQRVNPSKVVL